MNLPPNCILVRRDGHEIAIEDFVAPIHDRAGLATGAVIVFRDGSVGRAMAQRMAHAAEHDFLTGLPDRMLLNDRVDRAIGLSGRHTTRVAMLFLDLDGFKHINDSLGHSTGDKLLQSVARRLVECVRHSDTVSRQGGDEFVVLLSEMQQWKMRPLRRNGCCWRWQKAIPSTSTIFTSPPALASASIPTTALMRRRSSRTRTPRCTRRRSRYQFFASAMNVRAVERHSIEESLRRGLERQEFALHYQPKIDLRTGAITGA